VCVCAETPTDKVSQLIEIYTLFDQTKHFWDTMHQNVECSSLMNLLNSSSGHHMESTWFAFLGYYASKCRMFITDELVEFL